MGQGKSSKGFCLSRRYTGTAVLTFAAQQFGVTG
jgi:hypothetical protein